MLLRDLTLLDVTYMHGPFDKLIAGHFVTCQFREWNQICPKLKLFT